MERDITLRRSVRQTQAQKTPPVKRPHGQVRQYSQIQIAGRFADDRPGSSLGHSGFSGWIAGILPINGFKASSRANQTCRYCRFLLGTADDDPLDGAGLVGFKNSVGDAASDVHIFLSAGGI